MAAVYGSHSGTTYASRANTTITAPSGIVNNDALLLFFLLGASTEAGIPTPTWPSGFSVIEGPLTRNETGDPGNFSVRAWLLRKHASGESGNYTITHSTASSDGIVTRVSGGADAAHDATSNGGTGTGDITYLGVTTINADAWIGVFGFNWVLWGTGTVPSGSTPTFTERQDSASSLIYFADGPLASPGATGNKTMPSLNTNPTDNQWGGFLVAVESLVLAMNQYGFRARNDDGSESAATWKAAQDAGFSIVPDVPFRLRLGIDATGNQPSKNFKLQYRKVGDAGWRDVQ